MVTVSKYNEQYVAEILQELVDAKKSIWGDDPKAKARLVCAIIDTLCLFPEELWDKQKEVHHEFA